MIRGATLSPCRRYRYTLTRRWDVPLLSSPATTNRLDVASHDRVAFLMLNPSTADSTIDDPTIRRCIGFAQSWGFASLLVLNLFAWRATNPDELKKVEDPIGPENDKAILDGVASAQLLVCAWGACRTAQDRAKAVLAMLPVKPYCLAMTNGGEPKHPLYLSGDLVPIEYRWKS